MTIPTAAISAAVGVTCISSSRSTSLLRRGGSIGVTPVKPTTSVAMRPDHQVIFAAFLPAGTSSAGLLDQDLRMTEFTAPSSVNQALDLETETARMAAATNC